MGIMAASHRGVRMQGTIVRHASSEAVGVTCRNTYSALSALAGHYNNFGPETNVPKRRLDRLTKVSCACCLSSLC